jgi:uncharacterized Zn finger protein (UPF0148 family)
MVTATSAPAPQGHCSQCGKVWTLETGQGICQWCGRQAYCESQRTNPRPLKSSRRRKQRQADDNGHNGYDQLEGEYLTYYKVASQFSHKVQAQDREDLLHTIIVNLADVARNNGHKPFTELAMYRVASITVVHYWREQYKLTNGIDCGSCSKAQRRKCRKDWLYLECPKAIKLEYLSKPIVDNEGNLTELGELIADDKAIDLDAWLDAKAFRQGCPQRLISIGLKIRQGQALDGNDRKYLYKWRKREQKKLF